MENRKLDKITPLESVLSHMNLVHILTHYFFKIHLILSYTLRLDLWGVFFHSDFPTEFLCTFSSSPCVLHVSLFQSL